MILYMEKKMNDKSQSKLDMLIAMGQKTGFTNQGEANANQPSKVEDVVQELVPEVQKKEGEGTAQKKAVKQKIAKPTSQPISNKLNALNLSPYPWLEASSDVIKPLIVEIPLDLKLLLEGIARAIPGQSMKSIIVHLLKSDLPDIAKELNLPLPESLK